MADAGGTCRRGRRGDRGDPGASTSRPAGRRRGPPRSRSGRRRAPRVTDASRMAAQAVRRRRGRPGRLGEEHPADEPERGGDDQPVEGSPAAEAPAAHRAGSRSSPAQSARRGQRVPTEISDPQPAAAAWRPGLAAAEQPTVPADQVARATAAAGGEQRSACRRRAARRRAESASARRGGGAQAARTPPRDHARGAHELNSAGSGRLASGYRVLQLWDTACAAVASHADGARLVPMPELRSRTSTHGRTMAGARRSGGPPG